MPASSSTSRCTSTGSDGDDIHVGVTGDVMYGGAGDERFPSQQMRDALTRAGFPAMDQAEITVLRLHAVEPPL